MCVIQIWVTGDALSVRGDIFSEGGSQEGPPAGFRAVLGHFSSILGRPSNASAPSRGLPRFYDREVTKKENLTTRLVQKKNGLDPGIGTSPRFCLDERAPKIRVRQPDLTDVSQF